MQGIASFFGALCRPVRAAALVAAAVAAASPASAADVTSYVTISKSGLVFDRVTNTYDTTATVKNTSTVAIGAPMTLAVSSVTPSSVTLANAAGTNESGQRYVNLAGGLAPGASTTALLKFANPLRTTFSISTRTYGELSTLVPAPIALPTLAPDGTVVWPVPVVESSLRLNVRPFALLPAADSGRPPRLNALAYVGNRLFVLDEKDGKIFEITGGVTRLWFNVRTAVLAATGRQMYPAAGQPDNVHTGLRSLAFHPNFATNGKFYTSLLEQRPASTTGHRYLSDVTTPIAADSVLVEWTATNPTTTMDVASGSYREVFRVGLPVLDHPIKQITFRPGAAAASADFGLLYVAHGDASVQSVTVGGGMGNDARGKILRINPLQAGTAPFTVPTSNPFVGSTTMIPEAYSIGHRNPHHLAFARDGTLIVTEDGRDNIDEVNVIRPGQNYGWPAREGTYVHLAGGGLLSGIAAVPADDASFGYTYPAMQFLHTGLPNAGFTGQALGGGYAVENGSALSGRYFAIEFVKTGDVYFGRLDAIKSAVTKGLPSSLRQAPISRAKVLFDDDNNPATPALPLDNLGAVTRMGAFYFYTPTRSDTGVPCTPEANKCRADMRYGQGPRGELYLMSKLNRQVYLVTNSLPP